MRRCYSETVSTSDEDSFQARLRIKPMRPAQTPIGAQLRPIEPECLETSAPDAHLPSEEQPSGGGVR